MLLLPEMIEKAREVGACEPTLDVLRQFSSVKEALAHEKAPYWCHWYALNVIQGRWSEAEPVIAKGAYWAHRYALGVIQGRWSEAEIVL